MLNLGAFDTDNKTGKITGVFYGVNMYPTKLILEPATSAEGKGYYKIYAQCQHATVEAGAAWPKMARTDNPRPYFDIKLNSPGLSGPFYGKLVQNDVVPGQHHLLWDEPKTGAKARPAPGEAQRTAAELTM